MFTRFDQWTGTHHTVVAQICQSSCLCHSPSRCGPSGALRWPGCSTQSLHRSPGADWGTGGCFLTRVCTPHAWSILKTKTYNMAHWSDPDSLSYNIGFKLWAERNKRWTYALLVRYSSEEFKNDTLKFKTVVVFSCPVWDSVFNLNKI